MKVQENISLRPYNTFGIDAKARYFAKFKDIDELEELTTHGSRLTTLILGGGSNILFTKDYDGFVLKNDITGIEELHEDSEYVYVKAGAGENWHHFVLYCIERNWGGLENLSLIPGNVGASPMQNIGAYGVELDDVFNSLEAYHFHDKKLITFTKADCEFGYRDSVFKKKFRDQFVILTVTFQLRKKPIFHTSYGAIEPELERMGVKELSIKAISNAVINIRTSKLPDPKLIGNAGSFFKNPVVEIDKCQSLQSKFPGIIAYPVAGNRMKLAAGWLIDQCGPDKTGTSWRGFRKGDAGCYEKQALVLINYGNATGKEIYSLSEEILLSVKEKFGVILEREVNIF
ncbi:MAG: UDP-N-acetylmuramate dehydrogenase [Sphingobacteriales bacterium]|nr:UDP-N-acetylmuramate dehydrogenase [Sphingobacteriales bacterium]